MKKSSLLLSLILLMPATVFAGDGKVIVNKANQQEISENDIKRIYLGKQTTLSNGNYIIPVLPHEKFPAKVTFLRKVLNKSYARYRGYWSKQVFIGEGKPPKEFETDELLELVATNQDAIGVIDDDVTLPDTIRVIFEF